LRDTLTVDASPARSAGVRRTAGAVAAVVIALAGSAVATGYAAAGTTDVAEAVASAFVIGMVAIVGAVIILADAHHRVGWLLITSATLMAVGQALTEAGVYGVVVAPGSVPGAANMAAIGPALRGAGWLLAVIGVPAIFPDGRLPGARWRWLGVCVVLAATFLFLGDLLSPHGNESRLVDWDNPLGLPGRLGQIADAMTVLGPLLAVVATAGAVAGLITRWRRGGPLVRQQLALLALAACPPAGLVLVVLATNGVPGWVFDVVLVPFPVAIAVATLSYRLYDLRRATHRTLLWVLMSGGVIGIYACVVLAAAALVPDHQSWWPPLFAAGIAALLFIPLRRAMQRGVNRVVYGRWHEPYEVLAAIGEQLAFAADVDRLLDAAVSELTTGLDLRDVGVRTLDGASAAGTVTPGGTAVPLHAYGVTVGWLSYRPPDRHLSAPEERLLGDLARQLGGALHARALRADLQRARERLVLAREEERRRIRRDLHDGIGPALAGLTLKAETARALLPPGADDASRRLQNLSDEIRRTILDVRRVVEGLRPPALDELGLEAACAQAVERLTAETELVLDMQTAQALPALPAAVEVAAYRIVVEAVTNVVRHAGAHRCRVCIGLAGEGLVLTVSDDGTGLARTRRQGSGVGIMRERAEELGGELEVIDASPGVLVQARLPVTAVTSGRPTEPRVSA
jgi:signal transduction histidine kinase